MKKAKVSTVITTFNEEESIKMLLDSLKQQIIKPEEIIIIDAGSTDTTIQIIKSHKLKVKLFVRRGVSRAKGRNLGIKLAKNNIIAMTDAGCIAKKDWVKKIIHPFKTEKDIVVAGFYNMVYRNNLQQAMSVFLGINPKDFAGKFLPSTRSIAFSKSIWKKVGGFPERLKDTAEDTVFNFKLIENGVKIVKVKSARVEWGMPNDIFEFIKKIYRYAKGDAQSKIFKHKAKDIMSHNIKALLILLRYILLLSLFTLSIFNPILIPYLVFGIFVYLIWAFLKVYKKTDSVVSGLWGIFLQILCDMSVISGFLRGIL